ncbi:MAG: hypothetical protein PHE50_03790 [Dehalococcoidales bacterium]|nr:hypothetical protein [Dehalococcoidales bacterium]
MEQKISLRFIVVMILCLVAVFLPVSPTTAISEIAGVTRITTAVQNDTGYASFTISNLQISALTIQPGETVVVSVSVENSGTSEGAYTAILLVNETQDQSRTITLAAGTAVVVEFNLTIADPGYYRVSVGGLSRSFVVSTIPPVEQPVIVLTQTTAANLPEPIVFRNSNWYLVTGIITAGLLVVGFTVFYATRRRIR